MNGGHGGPPSGRTDVTQFASSSIFMGRLRPTIRFGIDEKEENPRPVKAYSTQTGALSLPKKAEQIKSQMDSACDSRTGFSGHWMALLFVLPQADIALN